MLNEAIEEIDNLNAEFLVRNLFFCIVLII